MRKLLVLGVLVALLLLGDTLAKAFAESAVESGIEAKVQGVTSVDAQIRSFPFTGRLVASGEVSELDLRLTGITGHGVDVAWLRLQTKGLALDRGVVFGGKVRIRKVDQVTVTANITEDEVRKVTGANVELHDGTASVEGGGISAAATVVVRDGKILLTVGALPSLAVPVPDLSLIHI